MTQLGHNDLVLAADTIRGRSHYRPRIGVVLGSGLNALADRLDQAEAIPFADIPHFPSLSIPGHVGVLALGLLHGVPLAVLQGRAHYYEGYSLAESVFPIQVLRLLGVDCLIVTNAAGAIQRGWLPGELMAITDHINILGMAGHNPLRGPNDDLLGPRFPAMSTAYDRDLLTLIRAKAASKGILLHEGVYAMVAGPNFETPAEVRFLRTIGADVVGMSTVPEVIVARHSGMRVLGLSCISNVAVDTIEETARVAKHEEVLDAGLLALPNLVALIEGVVQHITETG